MMNDHGKACMISGASAANEALRTSDSGPERKTATGSKLHQDLRNILLRTIHREPLRTEFAILRDRLNVSADEITAYFLYYNEDVYAFGNEVYAPILIRFVLHIHNHVLGSWHRDRQRALADFVRRYRFQSLVDLGYGVPGKYVREVLDGSGTQLVLLDKYSSARLFATEVLRLWSEEWSRHVRVGEFDLEGIEPLGEYDGYILSDSIEHARDPDAIFGRLVARAPQRSRFYLSIPVGPRIPAHFIEWTSDEEAHSWLAYHGLRVEHQTTLRPRRDADVFARALVQPVHCLVVDAVKR